MLPIICVLLLSLNSPAESKTKDNNSIKSVKKANMFEHINAPGFGMETLCGNYRNKKNLKKQDSSFFVSVHGHISMLSDIVDKSIVAGTFGYAVRGGYRRGRFGLFLHLEHNFWITTEFEQKVVSGAYNIGVGGEISYAGGFIHTSLALGPSTLAYNTPLDRKGKQIGVFFELRPAGFRWKVHKNVNIGFDPLNFAVVAPVLSGIPLIFVQYRTILYVEGTF